MINKTIKDKLMTYIGTKLAASTAFGSVEVFGPNTEVPDVESRTAPLIVVDIDDVGNKQFALGSRVTRKTGFVTVTLFVKVGAGINTVSEFKGLMDSIGLARANGITYKEPVEVMVPAQYKGWAPVSIALPFSLENYDV